MYPIGAVGEPREDEIYASTCSHKELQVIEETVCYSFWDFRDGKPVSPFGKGDVVAILESGEMTDFITVQCRMCGFHKRYNKRAKSTPKWVKRLAIAIVEL